MAEERSPQSEAPSAGSIYAPGAKPGGHGIRIHVGVKDLVYLAGVVTPAALWLVGRAPPPDQEAVKIVRAAEIASAVASATAPLNTRLNALERERKRNGKRWDALDAFHDQVFKRPNKTPPPKFGPRAEALGEVPAHTFDPDQDPD